MTYLILVIILLIFLWFIITRKKRDDFILTDEFKEIIQLVESTHQSIFISGKAGTGKSTLLKHITSHTNKKYVILAPTGVAAMNVRGQTIHSFFKFPPRLLDPQTFKADFPRNALFKNLDLIIIDEISMVNPNILDGIDAALKINRNNSKPFGGVQMIFIGDLFQLPPVVVNSLKEYFNTKYGGEYFFYASALKGLGYITKELTRIFRQKDENFKEILNRIRVNKATFEDFVMLNERHVSNTGRPDEQSVFLTTTNKNVKSINKENLEKISHKLCTFEATLEGKSKDDFDRLKGRLQNNEISEDQFEESLGNRFPADIILRLKKDCHIMMVKNDSRKRWVNGSLGKVKKIDGDQIWVEVDNTTHLVEREEWDDVTYIFDQKTKQIKENIRGKFRQFPIKLAWAMTIHKSQGKTFDKLTIDIGSGAFSHGQTYVALSRCKTLTGITLNRPIQQTDIIVDERVVNFYKTTAPKS